MRAKSIVKIVICSVVALLLIGVLAGALFYGEFKGIPEVFHIRTSKHGISERYDDSNYREGDAEITQDVRSVEVDWESGKIRIAAYDGDTVRLRETGASANDTLRWSCENGTLVIHSHRSLFTFSLTAHKDLEILLPSGIYNELKISTSSADIALEGSDLTFQTLETESASGNLEITGCTVGSIEFDSASGSCNAVDGSVNSFDMDTASGDATLSGSFGRIEIDSISGGFVLNASTAPDEISFDSTSGDAELTLPADAAFRAELDSVSGKLFANGFENGSYPDGIRTYVSGQNGRSAAEYDFETISGDVKIRAN